MTIYIQLANIILGLVAMGWLLGRSSSRWSEYPTEIRKLLAVTTGLIFVLIIVSGEQIATGDTLTFSVVLISVVKVALLYFLFSTRHTKWRTGIRQADGNPTADPNTDVR